MIELKIPSIEYSEDIWKFRQELLDENSSFDGTSCLKISDSPKYFIDNCCIKENDPNGYVPSSLYLAIRQEDNKIVGMIDLRHHINHPILKDFGGHIGYIVRPSMRRKDYGKEMLKECLIKAKELGIDKVLITCRKDNEASKRTILANGGIYERDTKDGDIPIERYWISL